MAKVLKTFRHFEEFMSPLLNKLEAVLIDADGVVFNTSHPELPFLNTALIEAGYKKLESRDEYLRVKRCDSEKTIESYFEYKGIPYSEEMIKPIADKRKQLIYDLMDIKLNLVFPGSVEAIKQLHKAGVKIFGVTGLWKKEAKKHFESIGIKDIFSGSLYYEDYPDNRKPDQKPYEMMRNILLDQKVSPENSIVIEDSPEGIESAKKVNFYVLGLAKSEKDRAVLKEKGADVVVDSLNPLLVKALLKIAATPLPYEKLEGMITANYIAGSWKGFWPKSLYLAKKEMFRFLEVIVGQTIKVEY